MGPWQSFSGFCFAAPPGWMLCSCLKSTHGQVSYHVSVRTLAFSSWELTSGPITPSLPTSLSQLHGIGYESVSQALGFIFFSGSKTFLLSFEFNIYYITIFYNRLFFRAVLDFRKN